MIKYLIDIFRRTKLMDEIDSDVSRMFDLAHTLFDAASGAILFGKPVEFDLYAKDREINYSVISVRRRIVEHMSVQECKNPVEELMIVVLTNNIERIGDHSKNMMDIYRQLGKAPLDNTRYLDRVKSLHLTVEGLFAKSKKALFEDDEDMARKVMKTHLEVTKICGDMMTELMNDEEISTRQAVALSVVIRSFKRASAHLKTISTSAVHPFMLMGYFQMPELGGKK